MAWDEKHSTLVFQERFKDFEGLGTGLEGGILAQRGTLGALARGEPQAWVRD